MSAQAAVVIPIYKEQPDTDELLSLKQCLKVIGRFPLIFICPATLDTTVYEAICANRIEFTRVDFESRYFLNIPGYNRLMLSADFYEKFLKFKFILIYQLDAFVFKDELDYWCRQNFDYIGAPHSPHKNETNEIQFLKNYSRLLTKINKWFGLNHQISDVGNGGFSLRKTRKCYLLLKILKKRALAWEHNEDGFFKYWGNILWPFFKLPTTAKAIHFSVETEPGQALKLLNDELPFGCHAFKKYEWESTWEPIISKFIETE